MFPCCCLVAFAVFPIVGGLCVAFMVEVFPPPCLQAERGDARWSSLMNMTAFLVSRGVVAMEDIYVYVGQQTLHHCFSERKSEGCTERRKEYFFSPHPCAG